ncbi:MAG: FAD:protein transferase [Frankiales bacterium]|jgi:thiamine biosynthesis lipoprotein|nr:FAD:protein transferase [Frankiales bacterium]
MPDVIAPHQPHLHRVVDVMGTVFSIDIRSSDLDIGAVDAVVEWWHWVDATFSTYRPSSDINVLGRGEKRIGELPPEVAEVLSLCTVASERTNGYFNACRDGELDPSGLVKGWSIEVASRMLVAAGSTAHCLNGGGDVRVIGQPAPGSAWNVGIADPRSGGVLTVVAGTNLAVATSGSAERGSHIFDPHTGRAVTDPISVTVVGPDLTWADVYATAAVAMGSAAPAWLDGVHGYEGIGLTADGQAWRTAGWWRYLPV